MTKPDTDLVDPAKNDAAARSTAATERSEAEGGADGSAFGSAASAGPSVGSGGPIAGTKTADRHVPLTDAKPGETPKPVDPLVPSQKLAAEMEAENPNRADANSAVDPDAERHQMAATQAKDRDWLSRGMQPPRKTNPNLIEGTRPEDRVPAASGGVPATDAGGYFEGDTALAHARRMLSAASHSKGAEIPIGRLSDLEDMGLSHILVDKQGRVWRVERPDSQNGRRQPVLVLAGTLQT